MMRGQFAQEAASQADAMLAAVEQLQPGGLAALREDPLGELQRWMNVQVSLVPETGGGGRCSVAGSYLASTTPPTLVVSRSNSRRRRGFTGLHELGHHIQKTDPALGQSLFRVRDSEGFEEAACDAFAARVLLPEDQILGRFGQRGPTATAVVDLFHASQASREACCVRAAEYLVGGGLVVLLDPGGMVIFAAPRSLFPPARGSDQSSTPLVSAALRASATVERDKTFVVYETGDTSDALYGQAAWCDDDYLIAVLASDNVPWRDFAPPRPNSRRSRFGQWHSCETCEVLFQITEPVCERCNEPRCKHGHCGCTTTRAANDRRCTGCNMVLAPARFDGAALMCRDCAG